MELREKKKKEKIAAREKERRRNLGYYVTPEEGSKK